jgi:tRNA-dihydrouridine synthase B
LVSVGFLDSRVCPYILTNVVMLKIGPYTLKNPFILAPMAGVSQLPFRRLALRMGAGLAPTELVSAKGLFFDSVRTCAYLIHDREIETPFCVQLFGGEAESMAHAALKAMAMGAQIIDINMGCPVKKVTKIHAGSALLCDYLRATHIVQAMLKSTGYKIPITAKIRSGWDSENLNFLEVGKALEEAGISALTIHPRTRAQGYSGKANWAHIAELKQHLHIPVIGNGDVTGLVDATAMRQMTGCDGVMIGRAALGNPWIFRALAQNDAMDVVTADERWQMVKEHLHAHFDLHRQIFTTIKPVNKPFDEMHVIHSFRSHLIWYSKGLIGGSKFRQCIMTSRSMTETIDVIDDFFCEAKLSHGEREINDEGIDYRQAFG